MRFLFLLFVLHFPTTTYAMEENTKKLYRDYCAHCHGYDGRPKGLVERVMPEIPDFSQIDWKDYAPIDFVESITAGSGQMPAFASILSKEEVKSLSRLLTTFPKGRPNSMIRRRWNYVEQDGKLKEQLEELILTYSSDY